ncbi:hypothetical protein [Methanobrevibacter sp.]
MQINNKIYIFGEESAGNDKYEGCSAQDTITVTDDAPDHPAVVTTI